MSKKLQDKISLDIRNSEGDWNAFLADRAPEDAGNVILHDDPGCAARTSAPRPRLLRDQDARRRLEPQFPPGQR